MNNSIYSDRFDLFFARGFFKAFRLLGRMDYQSMKNSHYSDRKFLIQRELQLLRSSVPRLKAIYSFLKRKSLRIRARLWVNNENLLEFGDQEIFKSNGSFWVEKCIFTLKKCQFEESQGRIKRISSIFSRLFYCHRQQQQKWCHFDVAIIALLSAKCNTLRSALD